MRRGLGEFQRGQTIERRFGTRICTAFVGNPQPFIHGDIMETPPGLLKLLGVDDRLLHANRMKPTCKREPKRVPAR